MQENERFSAVQIEVTQKCYQTYVWLACKEVGICNNMYAESIRAAMHIPLHLLPQFLMSGKCAAYVNMQQNKTVLWESE